MIAKKNYTWDEFLGLKTVTHEDLAAKKTLVHRDDRNLKTSESSWYVLYDTPSGRYITVEVWDTSGIKQTVVTKLEHIHSCFRLAPDPEPERKTFYVNVFKDGRELRGNLGDILHLTLKDAKFMGSGALYQIPVEFVKGTDGKWTSVTPTKPDSGTGIDKDGKYFLTLGDQSSLNRKDNSWFTWNQKPDNRKS